MNSNEHPFNFDPNFGFGRESVFTDVHLQFSGTIPVPPDRGYFLELQGGPFLLLDGQDMVLLQGYKMSQNIQQIFVANPAASMVSTDLLYLGRSPYNAADDFAITFANFVGSIGTATPTASTIPRWDANVNLSANSFLPGFATTATAAGTTTLLVGSKMIQEFTGATTQTVTLPVTSTLVVGQGFQIINNSSGAVTVNSSGGNLIQVLAANTELYLTCILASGTTATSWQSSYISDGAGVLTITGTANQVIASAATGNVVLSLPQSIATVSTPTFAGLNLTNSATTALNIAATSATGIPYIQLFRNTSTAIAVFQGGSSSDGSATGSGLWINNTIAGGSIYLNVAGSGNLLTLAPNLSTFLGASDTAINIVSSSATGQPYIQWTNNASTAINYIQAGTNVLGNASSTGTLFVNNIAGGDFFFNVTGTGNLLTLGVAAATFTKNLILSAGELHVGTSAGGGSQILDIYAPTAAMGVFQLLSADTGGNFIARLTHAAISASRTWTLPDASGTIALTSSAGGLTPNSVAGTTVSMAGGNAYFLNNAGATTATLPASGSSTIGDVIKVKGASAAPFIVQANTGQTITDGATSSSVAGTATSNAGTDSIQLVYVSANTWSTDWQLSVGFVLA